jgi:cyclohexadieny/prephenate dehydrogenase
MAHAMRAAGLAGEIVGYARRPKPGRIARDLFCDRVTETAAEAVQGADLVVLACRWAPWARSPPRSARI